MELDERTLKKLGYTYSHDFERCIPRFISKKAYRKTPQRRFPKKPESEAEKKKRYLRSFLSVSIRKSLKYNKPNKVWELLVGYDLKSLKRRLKKTVPDGYTWDDFLDGKLHIDHIFPVSAFKYEDAGGFDFRECWGLKNLRLLPATENLQKKNKIIKPFQTSFPFRIN